MEDKDKKKHDEWVQYNIIHCPNKKCSGMLLQNKYSNLFKCSNCGKKFIRYMRFSEVKK